LKGRKMKKYIICIILFLPLFTVSQSAQDVLRYSRYQAGGSARYMAVGGAFGALGADFTLASVNPAGLGFYKTSEAVFTPAVHSQTTQSVYNGFRSSDSRTNFYLGNLGVVISSNTSRNMQYSGWKNFQFAAGINRLNDFNNKILINGPNPENSLLHAYRDYAQGPPQIPYEDIEDDPGLQYADDLNLAWWTFLLDINDTVNYDYITPVPYAGVFQTKEIETYGSMNEFVLSGSANYSDRLYLGLTLSIPYLKYVEKAKYKEEDIADTIFDFKEFTRESYLETRGSGINLKFGLIFRATDWLRLGAAVHTPTWFTRMEDTWWTSMESSFDNGDEYYEVSPEGIYEYSINTPFRAIGSMAFLFGERGLISVDYEYADYSTGKLKGTLVNHDDANAAIQSSYGMAHHIRAGTEWRHQNFSFRAGYRYAGSPYQSDINDGSANSYSVGIGYRNLPVFFDLAYVHQRTKLDYYLYLEPTVQANAAENLHLSNHFILSVGYRF
jgi:hypothetical protein